VKLSKARGTCVLHVDIGGGTTKLALIDNGVIVGVAAFAVGGRLIATDAGDAWTRVDDSARLVARHLGFATDPQTLADPAVRTRIARSLATIAADTILGVPLDPLGASLQLTELLPRTNAPAALTFSGGVSEYIFSHEDGEYGDIAKELATELCAELSRRTPLPLIDPGQRIRATVIGASQFTVQVSGKTIYLPQPNVLPVHNIPVVHVGLDLSHEFDSAAMTDIVRASVAQLDLDPGAPMAIAFRWAGDPEYSRLRVAGEAIMRAVAPDGRREELLVLMIDGDVGRTFGHLLQRELDLRGPIVSIDGVQLQDLDYVDVGEMISPPGVVPVVIKSLLFS
jgi:ethanolamine utilization protein EutA